LVLGAVCLIAGVVVFAVTGNLRSPYWVIGSECVLAGAAAFAMTGNPFFLALGGVAAMFCRAACKGTTASGHGVWRELRLASRSK